MKLKGPSASKVRGAAHDTKVIFIFVGYGILVVWK